MRSVFTLLLVFFACTLRADTPFSVVTFPGNVKRDSPSQVGLIFQNRTGENVVITQLGRWVQAGNSQLHTLYLYDADAHVLGSVVVNCSGAAAGAFVWGVLPSPATITPGQYIYVMSTEIPGGDAYFYAYGGTGGYAQVTYADIGGVGEATFDGNLFSWQQFMNGYTHGPVSFQYTSPLKTWTKNGKTYTTDGGYYNMISAINNASVGDTVTIPSGTYTWGAGGTQLNIKAGVTLAGAGQGNTVVNIASDATPGVTNTLIALNQGSQLRGITFYGPATANASLFSTGAASGWRVADVGYHQAAGRSGYFAFLQNAPSGLIDGCSVTGGHGTSELIFHRGSPDSWQTASSMGRVENLFIEDCTFSGQGYVCDANSNSRMVVRGCTITGTIKIDGHGLASNTPARGVRHMEVYNNIWTSSAANWAAIELRGGAGMVFNNKAINSVPTGCWFHLTDYGYTDIWPNFGNVYQTPANYPVTDQIGVGMDPKAAASEPMYLWNNLAAAMAAAGSATVDWTLTWKQVPQAAIAVYRSQTGNPTATFTMQDVIKADRDYYKHTPAVVFNGTSGVGIGTKAQMLAIPPPAADKAGVGFWVTDEGEWNALQAGPDGQLYTWNGTNWVLKYTPFSYPHPIRRAAPPSNLRLIVP